MSKGIETIANFTKAQSKICLKKVNVKKAATDCTIEKS